MATLYPDYSLQALLDLNGHIYFLENGKFWVKFAVHMVYPTKYIPHGISYSLTLHDHHNKRVVGFDNAHDCLPKSKNHRAKKIKWDHIHKKENVYYYEFNSPAQLLVDFWATVDELSGGN